jgi:uncharacterized protein GlcG (DUF336 family)
MKAGLVAVLAIAIAGSARPQTPLADAALDLEPSVPARIEAMPRELPRARGPGLEYSLQLAQAAVNACAARNERVSVRVADSVGTTIVLLSGDGAGERSQLITAIDVAVLSKYRMPASMLKEKARTDPTLARGIRANPRMATTRGGSLMLMSGATFVGALAVSGAPGRDQVCADEALARHPMPQGPAESVPAEEIL